MSLSCDLLPYLFRERGYYADGPGWCRLGGAFMVDLVENAEEKGKEKET